MDNNITFETFLLFCNESNSQKLSQRDLLLCCQKLFAITSTNLHKEIVDVVESNCEKIFSLIRYLRPYFLSNSKTLKTILTRLCRHLMINSRILQYFWQLRYDWLIFKCFELDERSLQQKFEALRVFRHILEIDFISVPIFAIRCLISLIEGNGSIREASLEILRDLFILNPLIVAYCDGVLPLVDALLCEDVSLAKSVAYSFLMVLDHPKKRHEFRWENLLVILDIFEEEEIANEKVSTIYQIFQIFLKSWVGFVFFDSLKVIDNLLTLLKLETTSSKKQIIILNIISNIFGTNLVFVNRLDYEKEQSNFFDCFHCYVLENLFKKGYFEILIDLRNSCLQTFSNSKKDLEVQSGKSLTLIIKLIQTHYESSEYLQMFSFPDLTYDAVNLSNMNSILLLHDLDHWITTATSSYDVNLVGGVGNFQISMEIILQTIVTECKILTAENYQTWNWRQLKLLIDTLKKTDISQMENFFSTLLLRTTFFQKVLRFLSPQISDGFATLSQNPDFMFLIDFCQIFMPFLLNSQQGFAILESFLSWIAECLYVEYNLTMLKRLIDDKTDLIYLHNLVTNEKVSISYKINEGMDIFMNLCEIIDFQRSRQISSKFPTLFLQCFGRLQNTNRIFTEESLDVHMAKYYFDIISVFTESKKGEDLLNDCKLFQFFEDIFMENIRIDLLILFLPHLNFEHSLRSQNLLKTIFFAKVHQNISLKVFCINLIDRMLHLNVMVYKWTVELLIVAMNSGSSKIKQVAGIVLSSALKSSFLLQYLFSSNLDLDSTLLFHFLAIPEGFDRFGEKWIMLELQSWFDSNCVNSAKQCFHSINVDFLGTSNSTTQSTTQSTTTMDNGNSNNIEEDKLKLSLSSASVIKGIDTYDFPCSIISEIIKTEKGIVFLMHNIHLTRSLMKLEKLLELDVFTDSEFWFVIGMFITIIQMGNISIIFKFKETIKKSLDFALNSSKHLSIQAMVPVVLYYLKRKLNSPHFFDFFDFFDIKMKSLNFNSVFRDQIFVQKPLRAFKKPLYDEGFNNELFEHLMNLSSKLTYVASMKYIRIHFKTTLLSFTDVIGIFYFLSSIHCSPTLRRYLVEQINFTIISWKNSSSSSSSLSSSSSSCLPLPPNDSTNLPSVYQNFLISIDKYMATTTLESESLLGSVIQSDF
eukprot:TRINITY_DN1718_c0_g1_i1.p1 TRINITY_DN1718_c0_g1~~TRINITY_DN1718_c0_g1_i1.p1  ORF type:complete len:1153 (-),score=244.38 TRINITY_DN1718_c0_g1_i1:123-3581(-)